MPAQTYALAKAELATVLASCASIVRVYANPPSEAPQDVPAIVLLPDEVTRATGSSLLQRVYAVRCRLLLQDQQLEDAVDLVETIREEILDALDLAVTLHGTATHIASVHCDAPTGYAYPAGSMNHFIGFDTVLDILFAKSNTYAA